MRIQSWLLLAVAMACGTAFAFLVGLVWFPLKPVVHKKEVPQTQVLVATRDIPVGTTLYADSIRYEFVPNEQIPIGATNDFYRVYARKTLNPILQGDPICDLDLDGTTTGQSDGKGSLPFGTSIVRFQINRIQGTPLSSLNSLLSGASFSVESLSHSLETNGLVDLVVLETSQKLDDAGLVFLRKPPRLVASGLPIYSALEIPRPKRPVSTQPGAAGPWENPVISVLMSQKQIELAKTAAKEGRLQIRPHVDSEKVAQTVEKSTPILDAPIAVAAPAPTQPTPVQPAPAVSEQVFIESPKTNELGNPVVSQNHETPSSPSSSPPAPLERKTIYPQGEIRPVNGTIAVTKPNQENSTPAEKSTSSRKNSSTRRTPGEPKKTAKEPTTEPAQPLPKVIEIGLGPSKRSSAKKSQPVSSPVVSREDSTQKSSGQPRPSIDVYSFAPKNKKKTDLFPKHYYGATEILEETGKVAAL